MRTVKQDLALRLFDYLNKNLTNETKRSITSSQLREIIDTVTDWVYRMDAGGNEAKPIRLAGVETFMDELHKL